MAGEAHVRVVTRAIAMGEGALRADWRCLPAQLIGRLVGMEAAHTDVLELLTEARWFNGAEGGWWCPLRSATYCPFNFLCTSVHIFGL